MVYGLVPDENALEAIGLERRNQPMYNLTVDGAHTFFVGDQQWLVHNTCGGVLGFAEGTAHTAFANMRSGGGHAIRHLQSAGLIPSIGSLEDRVQAFERLFNPILENPVRSFDWRIGGQSAKGFAGRVNGQWVAVMIAKDGPYQGTIISAIIRDANQKPLVGLL